jgi:hypothetical protein
MLIAAEDGTEKCLFAVCSVTESGQCKQREMLPSPVKPPNGLGGRKMESYRIEAISSMDLE